MIEKEKITETMQNDRAFIIAAVSCDLIGLIKKEHDEWLDNGGYASYYDLVIEVVDYMLFTKGSTYLNFMEAQKKDEDLCFNGFSGNCFDWFHMELASKLITEELLNEVCFGDPKKYFAEVEKAKKKAKKKAEKEVLKKKMVRQVIPQEQVAHLQRALNLLESALSDIPQAQKDATSDISHDLFDIVTLRGILKGEVSVVWPKEDTEGFSFKHSVDFPDYGDEYPLEEI